MRRGFSLLTLGIGWALLATASCNDEATGSKTTGGGTAYCHACEHSSDCASGDVCRVVQGAVGVCAKASDKGCCDGPNGVGGNCYNSLGPDIDGGTGGTGGSGIIGSGGTSGAGAKGGSGGLGASGGSGGSGNTGNTSGNLGRACVNTTDCADPKLTCVTNDGLSGGGPAKGICTAACQATTDCLELADTAYCVPFSNGDTYCIEGCTEGDSPKCHERDEVACTLIGLIPSGTACTSTSDCSTNELCDSTTSECGQIVTGCMPTCGGDYDCGSGQFCDFSTGFCTATKPTGLPLGSPCNVPTGNQTDPCNGFCLAGSQDMTKGECSALCSLNSTLTGCGWDGTGAAENACIFATILSSGTPALQDVGLCGKICDCNRDCTLKGDYCVDETGGSVMMVWGRPGYCRPLQPTETVSDSFSKCPAGGTGGSAGMSGTGGTSGTKGEAGEAGAGAGGQAAK
jgi:hypothetical protein